MSDTGQGGGQRSWWEKPDAEPTPQDPYAPSSTSDQGQGGDAHDPYRTPSPDAPTQAQPTTPPTAPPAAEQAPTQSLPSYGQPTAEHGAQNPYGQQHGSTPSSAPSSAPSWENPQPTANQPYGSQYGNQYPGQQQYADQPYPAAQPYRNEYANQQYPNQQYPNHPHDQPPVTGMAHAVLWTSVGGILLSWTLLGWIASIVALALTPGARREIIAANGAKRGLGFLLAGKIVAWVNIGLTVLGIIALVAFFGWIGSRGWNYDDGGSWDTNVSVLFRS